MACVAYVRYLHVVDGERRQGLNLGVGGYVNGR